MCRNQSTRGGAMWRNPTCLWRSPQFLWGNQCMCGGITALVAWRQRRQLYSFHKNRERPPEAAARLMCVNRNGAFSVSQDGSGSLRLSRAKLSVAKPTYVCRNQLLAGGGGEGQRACGASNICAGANAPVEKPNVLLEELQVLVGDQCSCGGITALVANGQNRVPREPKPPPEAAAGLACGRRTDPSSFHKS